MTLIDFKLHEDDFVWDYELHFPIPTLNYIVRRTGNDLLKEFDTVDEAKGNVIAVVRSAKNYLFLGRRDMLEWEWQIAHDIDLLKQVLEYLMEFLNFAFLAGDYADVFKVANGDMKAPAIYSARNNLVRARKVMPYIRDFRVGY